MYDSYSNGFIGSNYKNETVNFLDHIDPEDQFLDNLRKNPNWEYKDIQIEYAYNQYGHRSIEIDDLEDDYLLFTGCSYTEGVGLKLEHSFPNIVASCLGKTYYNLAVGGSCIETVMHNLMMFFSVAKKKPKYVIIQWPDLHRFSVPGDRWVRHYNGSSIDANDQYHRALIENEHILINKNLWYRYLTVSYLNNLGIVTIETKHSIPVEQNILGTVEVDTLFRDHRKPKARDLSHPGIIPHMNHAEMLLGKLKFLESVDPV
jgi:hypothetical protein